MTPAEEAVHHYLTLVNQHDVERALACLSETFKCRFGDSEYAMDKDAMANALGWDAGTNGRLEYNVVAADGNEITIEGHESNDFLSLIGIVSLSFRSTFVVDEQGLIREQRHHVDWGNVTMEAAMKPLIEWAAASEPEDLEHIYPHGQMIYTQDAGRRWIALARKWRAAHT